MSNNLTGLIPSIYAGLDVVSREIVGFIPAVTRGTEADRVAKGQSVTVPVTSATEAVDIKPGPTAPDDGDQNVGNVSITITKSKMAAVKWNGEEQLAIGPTGKYNRILADQFAQGFRTLVNEVERDLGSLYYGSSYAYGTAGTTPFGVKDELTDFSETRRILTENGAPLSDMHMVLGTAAMANARGKNPVLFRANESGSDKTLREGEVGRVEGFGVHESVGVSRVVKGSASGYLVNGEKKEGDRIIAIDTGSGSFNVGDVVTFAGDDNKYVIAVAAPTTITLSAPGLRQDVADNTAITVGNSYTANMAFSRNAFALACRTPAMPEGGDAASDVMNVTDPVSNITFQIALYRQYRQVRYEVGLAWGVASIKPEHAVLVLG